MARRFSMVAMVVASAGLLTPALAQFGGIFGEGPPRPPANVPGRSLPPPEPDIYPMDRLPPGPPPGRIQTQPLPPPPGATRAPDSGQVPLETRPGPPPSAQAPGAPGQRSPRPAPSQPAQPASAPPNVPNEEIVEPPAQKVTNPTAVFSGLDKITGRIIEFEVAINETVRFGALEVTPRVCYTRPATETQVTDGFIEVDELTLQGELKRIFTGWMFIASPGLNAVEHPIYDVWLKDCKGAVAPTVAEVPETPAPQQRPAQQRQQQPQQRRQPQQAQPRQTQNPSPAQPQLPPPPFR